MITFIRRVDTASRVVDVTVATEKAVHRIGHLPGEGWWCASCSRKTRCHQIDTVKKIVPEMENR